MILDRRIKQGKKPLGYFDADVAREYIGKKCYCSQCAKAFSALDLVRVETLETIDTNHEMPYGFKNRPDIDYAYCLPLEWVDVARYRAFTVDEFLDHYYFGDVVKFRDKRAPDNNVINFMVTGSEINGDKESIFLNGKLLPFTLLFEHYELFTGQEWVPFGIRQD